MRLQTFSRAQITQAFNSHCQARAANDKRGFKQEFEELSDVGKDLPTKAAEVEANKEKNRYPYILPYDHCRVRLSVQNSNPRSDYINASFVPGGGSERDFICTQGPLANTTADFWRMVWEQNVRIIVMVTALRHKDIVLCDKYWPLEPGTVYHGLIQVTTVTCKQGPDYVVTSINLRQRHCPADRMITHYYYHTWPDQGVPRNMSSLCGFTEHVRQHLETIPRLGPAVVHCSAGVGRSGTFVALLWLMQLCVRGVQPDIRAAVEDLRLHRMWMVQNLLNREPNMLMTRSFLSVHSGAVHISSSVSSSLAQWRNLSRPTDPGNIHKGSGWGSRLLKTRAEREEETSPSQTDTFIRPTTNQHTDVPPCKPPEEAPAFFLTNESRLSLSELTTDRDEKTVTCSSVGPWLENWPDNIQNICW